jgi:hypothetical protein
VNADSIPWGYSAGNTEIFNNNNALKTSSIKFSGASGVATGDSGIIIYNMTTASSTSSSSPDSFSNVPFDLAFTVLDVKATGSTSASSKASEVVHFSGLFNASHVALQSLLPGANPWGAPVTAQVTLGGDDVGWRNYSVLLASFTSPGQPGGAPGSIQAVVTVTPADIPRGNGDIPAPPPPPETAPSATPEPGTLVLAGISALPFVVWLRRRTRHDEETRA